MSTACFVPTFLTASLPERKWAFTRMLPRTWHGVYEEESFACVPRCQPSPTLPMLMKVVMYLKINTLLSASLDTTTILSHTLFTLQSMWENQPATSFLLLLRSLRAIFFTNSCMFSLFFELDHQLCICCGMGIYSTIAITLIILIASSALRASSPSSTDNSQLE